MAWTYLFFAGLVEVAWAIGLKYTAGFSRIVPSLLIIAAMAISLALLGLALKSLPVGRLRDMDRDWRSRHRGAWHLSVQRACDHYASPLHWDDCRWNRRIKICLMTLAAKSGAYINRLVL